MGFLSLVIPNIRALTDFDEDDRGLLLNMKTYILKTFGLCFVSVMLGTMVYNGLYRDILGRMSDVGAYFLSTHFIPMINSKEFDNMLMQGADYQFAFGESESGKAMTKVAKETYDKVKQYYGDVRSAENKWALGQAIEDWLASEFSGATSTFDGTGTVADLMGMTDFKMQYKVDVVISEPNTEPKAKLDTAKEAEFIFAKQVSEFGHKTTSFEASEDVSWVRVVTYFNRKEVRSSTGFKDVSIKGFLIKEGSSKSKYYLILPKGVSSPLKLGDTSWRISSETPPNPPSVKNYQVYMISSGDPSGVSGNYDSEKLSTSTRYRGKSIITSINIAIHLIMELL